MPLFDSAESFGNRVYGAAAQVFAQYLPDDPRGAALRQAYFAGRRNQGDAAAADTVVEVPATGHINIVRCGYCLHQTALQCHTVATGGNHAVDTAERFGCRRAARSAGSCCRQLFSTCRMECGRRCGRCSAGNKYGRHRRQSCCRHGRTLRLQECLQRMQARNFHSRH